MRARGREPLDDGHAEAGVHRFGECGLAGRGDEFPAQLEPRREFPRAVGDDLLFKRAHHLGAVVIHPPAVQELLLPAIGEHERERRLGGRDKDRAEQVEVGFGRGDGPVLGDDPRVHAGLLGLPNLAVEQLDVGPLVHGDDAAATDGGAAGAADPGQVVEALLDVFGRGVGAVARPAAVEAGERADTRGALGECE